MSLLLRSQLLWLLVNILTADDKYSRHYRENLAQPIQMFISKKLKGFSVDFIAFPKVT